MQNNVVNISTFSCKKNKQKVENAFYINVEEEKKNQIFV